MQTSERLYLLANPVIFTITIKGKKLEATFLSGSFLEGIGYYLHIMFSDGHSDSYRLAAFSICNSNDETDIYCEALKEEIYMPLRGWNPDMQVTVTTYPVNGNHPANIWIIQNRQPASGKIFYSVYCGNQFQFRMERESVGWHPKGQQGSPIDDDLIKVIKSTIRYQLQEA